MKDFINFLYRNHSLGYKLLLFISTTFLIVYLFPKSGKFKYNFEKGKPWQSESLQAPFDFAIKKTDDEINAEKQAIKDHATLYFDIDDAVYNRVVANYKSEFQTSFPDSLDVITRALIFEQGELIINKLYDKGLLNADYNFSGDRQVVILNNKIEKFRLKFF